MMLVLGVLGGSLSSSVFGQIKSEVWDQIPTIQKVHLVTTGDSGSSELSIMCYVVTDLALQRMGAPAGEAARIEELLGGHAIDVSVLAYGIRDDNALAFRSVYFRPRYLIFTQEELLYRIGYDDIRPITGSFTGELEPGTISMGMIRIPEGIDLSRRFTIWYGEESASLGPIDFGSPLAKSNSGNVVTLIVVALGVLFVTISLVVVYRVRKKRRQGGMRSSGD